MRLWRLAVVLKGEWLVYSMQINFIPTCCASIVINSVTSQSATEESVTGTYANIWGILVGLMRD